MYVEIISIAQHARPNVRGHREDFRAIAINRSEFAVITPGTAERWNGLGAGVLPRPSVLSISNSTPPFARHT